MLLSIKLEKSFIDDLLSMFPINLPNVTLYFILLKEIFFVSLIFIK